MLVYKNDGILGGLNFFAETFMNSSQSASLLNQDASFRFYLINGSDYSCRVNFDDGSFMIITDYPFDFNNTIIPHVFTQEKTYNISLLCENSESNLTYSILHIVQQEIYCLDILSPVNGLVNAPFQIKFSIQSGSTPQFSLNLNGLNLASYTYDHITKVGIAISSHALSSIGIYYINITAHNLISKIETFKQFEIGSPIVSPIFSILNQNYTCFDF